LQRVFGLLDFSGGGCAFLLQAAKRVEIALGGVAGVAGFDQLGVEGEKLFVRASGLQFGLVGLSGFDLSLSADGLAAQIGVIKLQ